MFPAMTVLLAATFGFEAPAESKVAPPHPGATIANFTLHDIHRRPRSLDACKDKQAFVVVFLGTQCPLANLYLPTLIELDKEYEAKGVQFLAINSNAQDTLIVETLLSVPDFDFNWQSVYRFAEPPRMPKGTKLKWMGEWDNSADNPRNPDPTKEVHWGFQTADEMMNGWMEVVWTPSGESR